MDLNQEALYQGTGFSRAEGLGKNVGFSPCWLRRVSAAKAFGYGRLVSRLKPVPALENGCAGRVGRRKRLPHLTRQRVAFSSLRVEVCFMRRLIQSQPSSFHFHVEHRFSPRPRARAALPTSGP